MSDSKKRLSKYQDCINESKEEIMRHLNMRAYIKNFLEKHIWLEDQTLSFLRRNSKVIAKQSFREKLIKKYCEIRIRSRFYA